MARLARSVMAAGLALCPAAGCTGPRAVGARNSGLVDSAVIAEENRPGNRRKTIATCL